MSFPLRKRNLLLSAAALLLLTLGVVAAQAGANRLKAARSNLGEAQTRLGAAQALQAQAEAQAQLVQTEQRVVAEAAGMGLDPANWVERRVALRQVTLSRDKGDKLIRDVARRPAQLFELEAFDVSVLGGEEGLFDVPTETTRGVQISLQGTVLTREAFGAR